MKTTGIVICNYNKCNYLIQCIQSVLESNTDDYDVFIVDNASADDSVAQVQKRYGDKVTLLCNSENLGGSGGFNTGIRKVVSLGYEYVWCLDNDTLVDEDALRSLQNFLHTHPQTGMVGSRVYHMEAPDYIQQNGMTIDYDNFCVEAKFLNRLEDGTLPEIEYSDAVAACSVLVRTSLIKQIGAMPEENFLYWDDTEWGIRCNAAGYKVATYGKSKVLHAMGAKNEVKNTFATYYAWRNWIRFFLQHTPENRLEDMCQTLLNSLFSIIYTCLYRNEPNKSQTVMYAFEDALNDHLGKASSDKYFDIEHTYDGLQNLVRDKKEILIEVNGLYSLASSISQKIGSLNPNAKISYYSGNADMLPRERFPSDNYNGSAPTSRYPAKESVVISLCEYIFLVDDMSLTKAYIDNDESVFATEDDALYVINYAYSLQAFVFAHKPLLLHKALEKH